MFKKAIDRIRQHNYLILISLLILIGIFYICLATLPKHSDFYEINFDAKSFAQYGLGFIDKIVPSSVSTIEYTPTYFVLQGSWIKLGSLVFDYDVNSWDKSLISTHPVYLLWGMLPNIACLFTFIALSYFTLKNKWLSLIGFGALTFVSVIVMGQIDIFIVLFLYLSLYLMLKASNDEKYLSLIFLGIIFLGFSVQFKTYSAMLFPIYAIYALSLIKSKNVPDIKIYGIIAAIAFAFIFTFSIAWVPFAKWFGPTILFGESNWLLNLQISPLDLPPLHTISIWLLGYAIIAYDYLRNILKTSGSPADKRQFIFYNFAILAWFFATVYAQPQWWVFLLPVILLVLDNFRNELNYLLCLALSTLYLFYVMMWTNNVDKIFVHYLPVIPAYGNYALILTTAIIAVLVIWTLEIRNELHDRRHDDEVPNDHVTIRSWRDSIAPLSILVVPFLAILIIVPPIILSTGAVGTKIVNYDMVSEQLHGNVTIGQSFISPKDDLEGIGIRFTYNVSPNISPIQSLTFHLRSDMNSSDIATVSFSPSEINDKQYTRITFPPIADSKDRRYYFFVESPDSRPPDAVSVLYEDEDVYDGGTAYIDGSSIGGDLSFETIHKSDLSDVMTIYY